jgi:ferric-dicitrate binding protein FerR (iron transport regulator)
MNRHARFRLLAASVVMLAMFIANQAMAQTPAGSVTTVTGTVRVERAGTTVPATPGMALDVGDRIVTDANSRVTITLTDNSKLELDESTSLVIDQQMVGATLRNTKLSLFGGVVRSFVSFTSSPTPNFEVHTPNAVASARGTEYDTGTDTKERKEYKDCRRFTQVSVYDGTVEVTNATNPGAGSVQVPAGHKTLVACGFVPEAPTEIGAAGAGAGAAGAAGAAAATAAGAGAIAGTTTGLLVGGAVVVGGTLGGVAAGGGFGGGSHPNKKPKSPNQ